MKRIFWVLGIGMVAVCLITGRSLFRPLDGQDARFRASVTAGNAPLTVQFTDTSIQGDAPITAWNWDFGDGAESTEQNPSHIYIVSGTYNVSLEITTASGHDTQMEMDYITVAGESSGVSE